MRLFISYAHNPPDLAAFVHRLMQSLRDAGHDPWIDSEQLRLGDAQDWRRALRDALVDKTDWTVGFLSASAMKLGGVCRDELAIALDLKGGCLTTVLLDPLPLAGSTDWDIPVSVAHAQWVDMCDWRAQQGDDAWYAARLAELLGKLIPELAQRFADEDRFLQDVLTPEAQRADIPVLTQGFMGRDWVWPRLDDWRKSPVAGRPGLSADRIFWLSGSAGTGKSAISAYLIENFANHVVSLNLGRYELPGRCDAGVIVRTLAYELARRAQDYRAALIGTLCRKAGVGLPDGGPKGLTQPSKEAIRGWVTALAPPAEAFNQLLVQPLAHAFNGGRDSDPLLLIIDGLDEVLLRERNHGTGARTAGVMTMLSDGARYLPSWVRILVTSREDDPIPQSLGAVTRLHLDSEASNRQDLLLYARAWLKDRRDLVPDVAEVERWVEAIGLHADGSFQYLREYQKLVEAPAKPTLGPAEQMPKGMAGIYMTWFNRIFDRVSLDAYRAGAGRLLAVLVAAGNPVPEAVLAEAIGAADGFETGDFLRSFGSLLERRGEGWLPRHKSMRDWLSDGDAAAQYRLDLESGKRRLRGILAARIAAGGALDGFARAEIPVQIAAMSMVERRTWATAAGDWDVLAAIVVATVEVAKTEFAWGVAQDWCAAGEALGEAIGDAWLELGWRVANEQGDIARLLGDLNVAGAAFRRSSELAARRLAGDRDDAQRQRDLSVSQSKIGDILRVQGDLAGALLSYRAVLAISEALAARDGGNTGWQHDLSVSQSKIGDVLRAQDDLSGALLAYRAALTISKGLAARDGGNTRWQRDLSVSQEKIGDVLMALGDGSAALLSYRTGLKIAEGLVARDGGNTGWQRDLSVSQERIGDVLLAEGDVSGAMLSYRVGLAIAEGLAARDGGNAE